MGRPKTPKTIVQKDNPISDQKSWPRRNGVRFRLWPTSPTRRPHEEGTSLASDTSPPPDGLSNRKAWPNTASDSDPLLRQRIHRTSAYRFSPTDIVGTDWDQPTGDAHSVRTRKTGGASKAGRSKSTTIPRTIPCAPVGQYPTTSLACQNPSSVVGADNFPIVLWAPSTPIPGKHGKAPPHASGHQQCCGRRHLPYQANMVKTPTCLRASTV